MINRRSLMRALALFGIGIPSATAVKAAPVSFNEQPFRDLQDWIGLLPHAQQMAAAQAKCNFCAKEHVELFTYQFARPADVDMAIREVAEYMKWKISLQSGWPTREIHWRIPLEWDIQQDARVVEYREDGPEKDFITDRRCVKDHNWVRVAAYCRFHAI